MARLAQARTEQASQRPNIPYEQLVVCFTGIDSCLRLATKASRHTLTIYAIPLAGQALAIRSKPATGASPKLACAMREVRGTAVKKVCPITASVNLRYCRNSTLPAVVVGWIVGRTRNHVIVISVGIDMILSHGVRIRIWLNVKVLSTTVVPKVLCLSGSRPES